MARYQYETSPKKIEEEYQKSKKAKKPTQKISQKEIKKKNKVISIIKVLAVFFILLTISYRNSLINEKFTEIKKMKNELALIEKENEQLEVNIESKLNLSSIEEKAKQELGMQKPTSDQTRYINIQKEDYIEPSSENVIKNEKQSIFNKIIKIVTSL